MTNDRATVLTVVVLIGLLALMFGAGTIYLLDHGKDSTVVAGLAGTALGSLGTLLATTSTRPKADPEAIAETARAGALADVASLAPVGAHFVSATLEQFDPPSTEPVEGLSEPSGFGPSFP